jgi:hypothetical protein
MACINSSTVTSQCNLIWNNSGAEIAGCPVVVGEFNNLSADPQFCDPASDNYYLQAGSPGDPGDPSGCGLRGAFDVGCGPVSVAASSWGSIKASYR